MVSFSWESVPCLTSMGALKELPAIQNLFMSLDNRFFALLLGLVITAIVQSSSVTVSIVLLLAQQGLLPLKICFFIILGCNIGACMSAMLASLSGGKKNAKRAALIHLLFNIIGSIIMAVILLIGSDWIEALNHCIFPAAISADVLPIRIPSSRSSRLSF